MSGGQLKDGIGSLSMVVPLFTGFLDIPGGCWGFCSMKSITESEMVVKD